MGFGEKRNKLCQTTLLDPLGKKLNERLYLNEEHLALPEMIAFELVVIN